MAQSALPKSCTILIAENEAIIRLELDDQLVAMGYQVLVASDADEAIEMLDTHPEIALLISDITMPGSMDGIRLAQYVRGRSPSVRIIVTSGLGEAPASALPSSSVFLAKPYGLKALQTALSEAAPAGGRAATSAF